MEHKGLTLEQDRNLIEKILDDFDMRYCLLFMYVIRSDLFKNLSDSKIIDSYERVTILDEVFKSNLNMFWSQEFLDLAIDLGLIKNVRSLREFEQKEDDFIVKFGEPVRIEQNTLIFPSELLYSIITKKFKSLIKKNFNLALTKLKSVRCETSSIIHSFIFVVEEDALMVADDFYSILDQFGNVYQAIKIEVTIEGFYDRFKEILDKIEGFLELYDPALNAPNVKKKTKKAIEENTDIVKYLMEEKVKLSSKFEYDKVDKNAQIFKDWNAKLLLLLDIRLKLDNIEAELEEIKKYYSGKNKKYTYLQFIERISFNEDDIVNKIQDKLVSLREKIVSINQPISEFTKKGLKLLNLDFERFVITTSEE